MASEFHLARGESRMKRAGAFFAILVLGIQAQPLSSPAAVKDGTGAVLFLRFSPDGRELARICQFGPVALLDTSGYRKARTFSIGMRMVAYSPDGTKIATAEGTDGARVWDASIKGRLIPQSVMDEVYMLDAPLRVLEVPSKDPKLRVFWTEFSPDGKRLITTYANGHVKVWNTNSWAVEEDLVLTDTEVRAAVFSPDGKTVMIGDISGGLHQWSFADKAEIKSLKGPNDAGAVSGAVFSPDGSRLVTIHQGASGSVAMLWNTKGWIAQIESGFSSAAFSKDGKLMALGGTQIKLIDPSTGKQIRTIELPQMTMGEAARQFQGQPNASQKIPIQLGALAFSPDGKTLAAGSLDTTIRLVPMTP
jgi:WD40 repeat protein